jgi:hypothetical protein
MHEGASKGAFWLRRQSLDVLVCLFARPTKRWLFMAATCFCILGSLNRLGVQAGSSLLLNFALILTLLNTTKDIKLLHDLCNHFVYT